jgi:glycosyltransferase involved in cell wall biosynthesis
MSNIQPHLPTLAIIVPCYNEEEMFPMTFPTLVGLIDDLCLKGKVNDNSFVCFVNDGSRDRSWQLIEDACNTNPKRVKGIKLATNFGHQNALMAGMMTMRSECDFMVSIDADLQDDIAVIETMVDKHREGFKVVYGVRNKRNTDTFFKKISAQLFYRFMQRMKVKTIYNHADFRLIDRIVADQLALFGEVNLFLRGMFPIIGFASTEVIYDRKERLAGETKYPLRKMISFAWDGITSFSTYPLRLIFLMGVFIFFISMLLAVLAIIPVFYGKTIQGWASTVIPIFVFAGIQIISIGLIGEYVGKIYKEVKARPRFIIETIKNNKSETKD